MTGDCITPPHPKDKDGYPRLKWHGRMWRVSRMLWTLMYGPIPIGKLICHRCDNPSCVNPDHLYLGSFKQNMQDKVDRNRVAGDNHPGVKISDLEIPNIIRMYREEGYSQQKIADIYGVSQSIISGICLGKRRKAIAGPLI
jgi:HNH endonuclease